MRKKCIVISTIIVLLIEILFPGLITYAEDGSSSSGNGMKISKSVNWYGTNNPDNYKATYRLFEYAVDLTIESIEDLIELSIDVSNGDSYKGKHIVLNKDLDFENDSSYKDPKTKKYGDVNKDGNVQTLKEELTNKESGFGFPPIGIKDSLPFSGNFYGENHEIKNLYINQTDKSEDYLGLFGRAKDVEIYDLTVGGTINSNNRTGAVIGGIVGRFYNSKIYNCYSKVNINVNGDLDGYVGGIVGHACRSERSDNNNIINCINTGKISFGQDNSEGRGCSVGGIAGYVSGNIQNCCNFGEIYTNLKHVRNWYRVGGIAGGGEVGYIDKCYNTANIHIASRLSFYVGGIIGSMLSGSVIKNSYNSGNIFIESNNWDVAGGITGFCTGGEGSIKKEIINCLNTGNISFNQGTMERHIYDRRADR